MLPANSQPQVEPHLEGYTDAHPERFPIPMTDPDPSLPPLVSVLRILREQGGAVSVGYVAHRLEIPEDEVASLLRATTANGYTSRARYAETSYILTDRGQQHLARMLTPAAPAIPAGHLTTEAAVRIVDRSHRTPGGIPDDVIEAAQQALHSPVFQLQDVTTRPGGITVYTFVQHPSTS